MKTNFKLFSLVFILLISTAAYSMESRSISEHIQIQAFLNGINLANWLDTPQNAETTLRVLKIFNNTMAGWLNNNEIWINQAPNELKEIKDIIFGLRLGGIKVPLHLSPEGFSQHIPNIPYLAKWIIPQDNDVITIGDLHGDFEALKTIIKSIHMDSHTKIVFLGDFMDRGCSSLKVFTTAALIALKYPGQVLMLRGNHEYIDTNLDTYGLESEIRAIGASDETVYGIIDELSKSYDFLPVGAFIGQQGTLPTKFIFHAHGCVDIRINCKDLLESDANNLSQNGGIKLWKFGPENIMTEPEKLIRFYKDIVPNLGNLMKDLTEVAQALTNTNPISGLLWSDISCYSKHLLYRSARGENIIDIDINMVKKYLENYNSDNVKVCGMIRAHQHNFSKEIYNFLHENSSNLKHVCRKITPACLVTAPAPTGSSVLLLENCNLIKFNNNFWVATLISAPIIENKYIQILYPPTFLRLRFNPSSGQHEIQAIFNTELLQN